MIAVQKERASCEWQHDSKNGAEEKIRCLFGQNSSHLSKRIGGQSLFVRSLTFSSLLLCYQILNWIRKTKFSALWSQVLIGSSVTRLAEYQQSYANNSTWTGVMTDQHDLLGTMYERRWLLQSVTTSDVNSASLPLSLSFLRERVTAMAERRERKRVMIQLVTRLDWKI